MQFRKRTAHIHGERGQDRKRREMSAQSFDERFDLESGSQSGLQSGLQSVAPA